MTKRMWVVLLLTALMVSGMAWAQEDTGSGRDEPARKVKNERRQKKDKAPKVKKVKVVKGEWEKTWAPMTQKLDLSADQTATLKQKVEAKNAAIAEWNKTNAEKLSAIKASMKDARKNENKDEMKKLKGEMGELSKARKTIETDATAACMGVLTAEQKSKWEGIKFCGRVMGKYRKAGLDETQQAKAEQLCLAAAAQLASADKKATKGVMTKLDGDIKALLTDAQKEKISARGKGKTEKAPKVKKAPKARENRKQADVEDID
ncbi:MAG: hypothetical protein ACOCZU_00930 [Planctomycetota bacterium]